MARFKNLQELFLTASARWANRVAFRHIKDGKVREVKYKEIARLSYRAAQALWQRGLRPGDYLGICASNSPEWVIACLAAFRLGAIVVPMDPHSRESELIAIVDKVDPKLVLFGEKQFMRAGERMPKSRMEYLSSIFIDGDLPNLPHFQSPSREDAALVIFTSGTSGASKGVLLNHGNILSNALAAAQRFDVSAGDRFLSILPLCHMLEFTGGLVGPVHKGATIVYCEAKGPRHIKDLLCFEKISILIGAPIIFESLYGEIEAWIEKQPRTQQLALALGRNLVKTNPLFGRAIFHQLHRELGGKIKFWLSGGAPTSPDLVDGLRSLGIPLLTGYGLTEASPIVSVNQLKDYKSTSVGRPLPGVEVKIDNPDMLGNGEILVSGPNIMNGYWNNQEETDRAVRNRWLHTGDVGCIDTDDHIRITGRMKSMIVTAGGQNIYPEELEEAIATSSLIQEICVFGRPASSGEEVCAVIVPLESVLHSHDCNETIKRELAKALDYFADHKRLSSYQIWETKLPRTPSGKVRRGEVIRRFDLGRKKKSKKESLEPIFTWDDDGHRVCNSIASSMNPEILRAICPSGSRVFPPEMTLSGELGLDSFSRLELVCQLDRDFSITLPEEALQEAQTVDDVVAMVKHYRQMRETTQPAIEDQENLEAETHSLAPHWKRWPHEYYDPSLWPHRDNLLITESRKVVGVGLLVFMKIYNSLETSGTDRLLIDPPYIIAANHSSHFDTLSLMASLPVNLLSITHPVAAADYFFSDKIRSALSTYCMNAIPFDRFGGFEESLKTCEQLLRKGHNLIIFPEGTRSQDRQIGPFKSGAAKLSLTVGCPIIPAYIEGTHSILPKGDYLPKPGRLKITFGVPLYPPLTNTSISDCQQYTQRLREAIISLQAPMPTLTIIPATD